MAPLLPKLTRRSVATGLGLLLAPRPGRAATRTTLGYTATLGFNAAFIARDRGFFAARGLDVDLVLVTLNSNIPGALMGGSIQVGGPTPTVLLQANDGGLDLVVIAGCAGLDPGNANEGLLARKGAGIAGPGDCVGKKIGVPGLNAYWHVMIRKWLADNGVDWRKVNFVEVPFTQSADVLRSGSVDAVATGEPFSRRIVTEGVGVLVVSAGAIAPAGTPSLFYAATRDWAKANPAAVTGFQAAIAEAVRFQAADPAGARASAAKFIRMPPEVMEGITLPLLQAEATPAGLQFWIDTMTKQDMLQEKPSPASLLVK